MKGLDQRERKDHVAAGAHLQCGRKYYEQRAWLDAYRALSLADREPSLGAEDLERLAMAAYLTGRDDEYLCILERAHNAHARRVRTNALPRRGSISRPKFIG